VTAWAISGLKDYELCPRKYHEERVLKRVERVYNAKGDDGKDKHKAIENYFVEERPLPPTLNAHARVLSLIRDKLEGMELFPEVKLGVTQLLTPCDFWDDLCWARGVADLVAVAKNALIVLDWKTGRPNDDFDQLALMALMLFAKYPHINEVRAGYYWMKEMRLAPRIFYRREWTGLWGDFVQRAERMLSDTRFHPRTNFLCKKWCPVKTCPYNGANA